MPAWRRIVLPTSGSFPVIFTPNPQCFSWGCSASQSVCEENRAQGSSGIEGWMKSEAGSAAECHSRAFPAFPARKDLVLRDAAPTPTPFHTCHPVPRPSSPPRIIFLSEQRLCCSSFARGLPKVSCRDPGTSWSLPGHTGSKPGGRRGGGGSAGQVTPLPLAKFSSVFLRLKLLPGDKQLLPRRRCRARSIPALPG